MGFHPLTTAVAAAVVALSLPSIALSVGHGVAADRLIEVLNQPARDNSGAIRFERLADCLYAQSVDTSSWRHGTFEARSEVDFAAASFSETRTQIADDGSYAVVEISNGANVDAVTYRTDYANVPEDGQTMLERIGATCDGSTCVRSGARDSFRVTIRGDDLNVSVAAVEADLLAIGAACAPN